MTTMSSQHRNSPQILTNPGKRTAETNLQEDESPKRRKMQVEQMEVDDDNEDMNQPTVPNSVTTHVLPSNSFWQRQNHEINNGNAMSAVEMLSLPWKYLQRSAAELPIHRRTFNEAEPQVAHIHSHSAPPESFHPDQDGLKTRSNPIPAAAEVHVEPRRANPLAQPPWLATEHPRSSTVSQGLVSTLLNLLVVYLISTSATAILPQHYNHTMPTNHVNYKSPQVTNTTLRDFLTHPDGIHLAMAPAFFGFYGYFGALTAWHNETVHIQSVAGASAGAMAAILLAAGIPPSAAAEFGQTITFDKFADFPGILALFQGHLFEETMEDFLSQQRPEHSLRMEDGIIPVAVSAFDIWKLRGRILQRGSMARAARASATFPFLFQPVSWKEDDQDYLLIDGGVSGDMAGLYGLTVLFPDQPKRVVNLVVGDFIGAPPGPSSMPEGILATEVLSITLQKLPQCGPWALEKGPKAVEAARRAMLASLDMPLHVGSEPGHFELHIDASSFVPES